MLKRYKKLDCPLCKAKRKSIWYFPTNTKEEKDIFWCAKCVKCKNPMIVYKWHNEPTDAEVSHMIEWAKKTFEYRTPDFQRRSIPSHFHFHMRRGNGKIDIKKRKTYFECPLCKRFFESTEMIVCTKCKIIHCRECYSKHECFNSQEGGEHCVGEMKGEEDLEFCQLDDLDYYASEEEG